MPHHRSKIRNKVADILRPHTKACDRVYTSRIKAIDKNRLPAINVQAYQERVELYNETAREYKRTLTVAIAIVDKAGDDLDDRLDDIAAEVEALILHDETLGGEAADTLLSDSDMRLELGDTTIGGLIITFNVEYFSRHQQDFDDLETLHYALRHGKDAEPLSETTIDIPT